MGNAFSRKRRVFSKFDIDKKVSDKMFKYATSALENLFESEHGYLKRNRMSCRIEVNIVQHLDGRARVRATGGPT